MARIFPDMTVADVLDIDPLTSRIFYQYGVRTIFNRETSLLTLRWLCQEHNISLPALLEDLNELAKSGAPF